jgi:TetR/AcrR family transcriptional regulator
MIRANFISARGAWHAKPADTVVLDFEERHRRRVAMTGVRGLEFLLDLPEAVVLRHGDALVLEHERMQERINLLFDKVEAQLRQSLREANADSATPTVDTQVQASLLVAFMQGRLQRFVRSGFKRLPSEHLQAALGRVL